MLLRRRSLYRRARPEVAYSGATIVASNDVPLPKAGVRDSLAVFGTNDLLHFIKY
jgi:hypothetical protein